MNRRTLFVFSVCRLVSRRCHKIGSLDQGSSSMQSYEGSESCTPSPQRAGLPTSFAIPSHRSVPNHVMRPIIALSATTA